MRAQTDFLRVTVVWQAVEAGVIEGDAGHTLEGKEGRAKYGRSAVAGCLAFAQVSVWRHATVPSSGTTRTSCQKVFIVC
jgi:hypothetical protein